MDTSMGTLAAVKKKPFNVGACNYGTGDYEGKLDDFRVYECSLSYCQICPWFCYEVLCAWAPSPRNGQMDVALDVILNWRPGDYAVSHDVYLGTDWGAVNDANTSSSEYKGNYDVNEYDPSGLELDRTYYWRVDEVNEPNVWKCSAWRFTTPDFLIVDDMEDYTVGDLNWIWETWDDGFLNWTGAIISLGIRPGKPVHSGTQSIEYHYDNTVDWGAGYYSEIDANTTGPRPGNLKIGKDWTAFGVKALTLLFYGEPNNDANEQMYVALENSCRHVAVVKYGDHGEDMNDIRIEEWHEWNIDLQDFNDAGVSPADVNKVRIGFGDRDNPRPGGTGIVYFDDIRLYRPKCIPQRARPVADFDGDCIVYLEDLGTLAQEWLTAGTQADLVADGQVNFRDYAIVADMWLEARLWPPEDY
jgi:hypothetical protein